VPVSTSQGELRYRLRCLDKLGHAFRGDESVLREYRRVLKRRGAALIVEANRFNPLFRGTFRRIRGALRARLRRDLARQHAVEECLERFPFLRGLLSYNFAVA
jgi:hypothetical protein